MSPQKPIYPGDLKRFELSYKQTSVVVFSDLDIASEVLEFLEGRYDELEAYCLKEPLFLLSYDPVGSRKKSPTIVEMMAAAAEKAEVGPMAAVAGAFSELVGGFLLEKGAREVLVENGGDIFMKSERDRIVGVYAGDSVFSNRIGFRVRPEQTPMAVCTSSSSVGHSVSLGDSDAVSVVAESCPLADAAATSIGNHVRGDEGISLGLKRAQGIKGIKGTLIIQGGEMGFWGELPEIVPL